MCQKASGNRVERQSGYWPKYPERTGQINALTVPLLLRCRHLLLNSAARATRRASCVAYSSYADERRFGTPEMPPYLNPQSR